MMDITLLFIFQNIIVMSFIFWALSFSGVYSFKLKRYNATFELFECGFLSSVKFNMQFNFCFLMVVWLLILYDVEFFFLVPYVFNWGHTNLFSIYIYFFFLVFICITVLYDYQIIFLNYYI